MEIMFIILSLIGTWLITGCSGGQITGRYQIGDFSLEWTDNGATIDFKFITSYTYSVDMWSAFAFSNDRYMGDDDVSVCIKSQYYTVNHYRNTPEHTSIPLLTSDLKIGFSNIQVSTVDRSLQCSFTRQKAMANVNGYFNLSYPYYLLFAFGYIDADGTIQYHQTDRIPGDSLVYFSNSNPTTNTPNSMSSTQSSWSPWYSTRTPNCVNNSPNLKYSSHLLRYLSFISVLTALCFL